MRALAPDIEWVTGLHPIGSDDDPVSRFLGHVRILGADFHVNAEQVEDVDHDDTLCQEPVAGIGLTYVEEIQVLCDGPGETVNIDGRDYLLVVMPYQK